MSLWLIAAVVVIVGIVQLFQGQISCGIALIVVGCLVGPGGYSIFVAMPDQPDVARRAEALVRDDDQGGFPPQEQQPPGLTSRMDPAPDHGETSYVGHGRMERHAGVDHRRRLGHRTGGRHRLRP